MMRPIVLTLALAVLCTDVARAQSTVDPLAGLWRARRWFGPEVRGPLVIRREGTRYTADLNGQMLPVHIEHGELRFEMPRGGGSFRGILQAGAGIVGMWRPPGTQGNGGYATPVDLAPAGPDEWHGEVVPYDDTFTFWLLLRNRPDGTYSALLRNVERDFGALLGVKTLVSDSAGVRLIGKAPWMRQPAAVATGRYDAEDSALVLSVPSRGGTYEFHRDGDDSEFYPRGKHPARYVYRTPLARDDDWRSGTLASVGHRSGRHRAGRSGDMRHADGHARCAAGARAADRPARHARARGVLPWPAS